MLMCRNVSLQLRAYELRLRRAKPSTYQLRVHEHLRGRVASYASKPLGANGKGRNAALDTFVGRVRSRTPHQNYARHVAFCNPITAAFVVHRCLGRAGYKRSTIDAAKRLIFQLATPSTLRTAVLSVGCNCNQQRDAVLGSTAARAKCAHSPQQRCSQQQQVHCSSRGSQQSSPHRQARQQQSLRTTTAAPSSAATTG